MTAVAMWFDRLLGRTPERRAREQQLEHAVDEIQQFREQLQKKTSSTEEARLLALEALKELRGETQ